MFQELMWLGAVLAILGVIIVAYLATLAIKRLIDRRNESQTGGEADYSRRLSPGDDDKP